MTPNESADDDSTTGDRPSTVERIRADPVIRERIKRIVDALPPLTEESLRRVATHLPPFIAEEE